jgi:hypothetical protein
MSSIAAICGEAITDPGDSDPAVECSISLTLGILRGKLDAELLCRRSDSELADLAIRVVVGTKISVRMCRSLRKAWEGLALASGGERELTCCLNANGLLCCVWGSSDGSKCFGGLRLGASNGSKALDCEGGLRRTLWVKSKSSAMFSCPGNCKSFTSGLFFDFWALSSRWEERGMVEEGVAAMEISR